MSVSNDYIRVAAAIPDVKVANCKYNMGRILYLVNQCLQKDVQIVAFPELAVTAYTCGDLFHQQLLLGSAEQQLNELLYLTRNTDIITLVGMPISADSKLFNCGVVVQNGKILGVVPKTHLPNHSEFYEKRWFASSQHTTSPTISLCNQEVPFGTNLLFKQGLACFGIEICEDLWTTIPPSCFHALNGANIIFNLSASNEIIGKHAYRTSLVAQQSARCMTGYVYVSCGLGESTTDVVYAGAALIAENGTILDSSKRFDLSDQLVINEIDIRRLQADRQKSTSFMDTIYSAHYAKMPHRSIACTLKEFKNDRLHRKIYPYPFVPQTTTERNERCEEIFEMQIQGLSKRLRHTNARCAIVGISGGLDSTLALLVTVKTFDKLNILRSGIIGVTMPGFGTTGRTYQNALTLMRSLGITIKEIDIKDACLQHFKDIDHDPNVYDVTYENTQARERTQILMDLANQQNGLVIGTGDLSELALGWATYNGDLMSMYAVNCSIPKTLVRFLVAWASENMSDQKAANTLMDILSTPVSPELLPANHQGQINQKTEDIVGPYELHDFFLYYMMRFGFPPEKIVFLAQLAFQEQYDKEVIIKWLKVFYRRFFSQQFKRSCMPDGPKIGSINLSPRGDWRMPSDASAQIWLDALETL